MRKKKKTNKQTRSEKRPFTSEKGKNPEEKKKSETERERRSRLEWVALKCQRGTMGGWVGFRSEWVTLRLARELGSRADLGLARAWVSRGGAVVR